MAIDGTRGQRVAHMKTTDADMNSNRLRAKDVLKAFPISRATLYRWAKEGKVPSERLPGTTVVFFSRVGIERRLKALAIIGLLLAFTPSTFAAPRPPVLRSSGTAGIAKSSAVAAETQRVLRGAVRSGTASWYSHASTLAEGNSGIQANGQVMNDTEYTAASWDYALGTVLVVRMGHRRVQVRVTDRGPHRRLYRRGRILDLSPAAFQALAPLSDGVIPVTIEALP